MSPNNDQTMIINDPVKLVVLNAPSKTQKINFHPSDKKLGSRTIKTI